MNKKAQTLFEKYYSRLLWEGIVKSLLYGLIVGFSAMTVAATITWITAYKGALWVSLVFGFAALAIAAPIFYFKLFRPTTDAIAKRLDGLGLEQRLITMLELEHDDSYIAMRQREDAKVRLNAVGVKQIKLAISKAMVIAVIALFAVSTSMTTVSALTASNAIPPVVDRTEPPVQFTVSYVVWGFKGGDEFFDDEGGIILGEADQVVEAGGSATTVTAVADDNWYFYGWYEDGSTNPVRTDTNIEEDMTFTAIFVIHQDSDEDEGGGGTDEGEPSDEPQDVEQEQNNQPPSEDGSDEDSDSRGGNYVDHNVVEDGETDYKSIFDEYYRQAMEILAEGGEIPDELREMLQKYFEMLS